MLIQDTVTFSVNLFPYYSNKAKSREIAFFIPNSQYISVPTGHLVVLTTFDIPELPTKPKGSSNNPFVCFIT